MVGGLATDFEIGRDSNGFIPERSLFAVDHVCLGFSGTASHLLVVARGYMCVLDRFLFSAIMATGNQPVVPFKRILLPPQFASQIFSDSSIPLTIQRLLWIGDH